MTRYKIAQVMARQEGFGKPGAIPTIRHNPLNLRHGPLAAHYSTAPNDIGFYLDDDSGWADGDRQLELWASRGLTLATMVATQAPPGVDDNNTVAYLAFVCSEMGMPPTTLVSQALTVPYDPAYS